MLIYSYLIIYKFMIQRDNNLNMYQNEHCTPGQQQVI